jgi:hypothetical protein
MHQAAYSAQEQEEEGVVREPLMATCGRPCVALLGGAARPRARPRRPPKALAGGAWSDPCIV